MNVIETQEKVQEFANTQSNAELRIATMKDGKLAHTDLQGVERIGTAIHQGDVYAVLINSLPENITKVHEKQLAPGTTKGSRHVAVGDVDIFVVRNKSPLQGPIVRAKSDWTITHPEHAHWQLPAGDYQIVYQQDHAQEEIAAVRD